MKRRAAGAVRRHGTLPRVVSVVPLLSACAPTVDVGGVYFPGWLTSAILGVVAAYAVVVGLGRSPKARPLADSGLFFVSLVVAIALCVWWLCFSGF